MCNNLLALDKKIQGDETALSHCKLLEASFWVLVRASGLVTLGVSKRLCANKETKSVGNDLA